jgi:putative ABC transport system permease protein
MLLRMAWRNLWRNVRRSLLTLSAMTLGVGAIVFLNSMNESTFAQMIGVVTAGLIGQFQIHGNGYQENPEITTVVQDPIAVEAKLKTALPDATTERRVLGYGLAGTEENSSAALVLGVDPSRESELIEVEQGRGLDPKPAHEVVLGRELARQLGVRVGSELVLVGQAADGSVANDRYTVAGIGDAGSDEMNANAVFMNLKDAQDFFGLGQGVHQILVRLPTVEEDLTAPLAALRGALDLKTLEALSWSEIIPELKGTLMTKRNNLRAADFIVFLIVGLGVLNAMMMSTFERTREFGVMASVGTRPGRILRLVLTESALQALIGLTAGLVLAVTTLYLVGSINVGSMIGGDFLGMRMPSELRLHLYWSGVWNAAVTVLVTTMAGGLWPAIRAARLTPMEAVRHV